MCFEETFRHVYVKTEKNAKHNTALIKTHFLPGLRLLLLLSFPLSLAFDRRPALQPKREVHIQSGAYK